jgi:hypothetical protein
MHQPQRFFRERLPAALLMDAQVLSSLIGHLCGDSQQH